MSAGSQMLETPRGRFHLRRWGDRASSPLLLFAHATGMCAGLYEALLAPLADRARIVAFDARGHGRTVAGDTGEPLADWQPFQEDMASLVAALGEGPVLLAGHSFGATVALEAAVGHPGIASAVLMVEPAFIPFAHAEAYRALRAAGGHPPNPMAERAARRRAQFASPDEMREAWRGRGVFAGWPGRALEAYLEGAVIADASGARLACTPAWEAAVFRGVSTTLEASLRAARLPVTLVRGTEGSTVTPDDAAAIAAMGHRVAVLEGAGHFVPIEAPGRVGPFLEALLGQAAAPVPQPRRAER
jgi:pimeloyl-ACP methyl ester carboxylesterase